MALTNEQLILLDNLIYLDDTVSSTNNEVTIKNVVNNLLSMSDKDFKKAVTDEQFFYCGNMVNGMTTNQWKNVLNAIAEDETLMNMKITNIDDDNDYTGGKDKTSTGFRAACFTNGSDTAVVISVGRYRNELGRSSGTAYQGIHGYNFSDLDKISIIIIKN